MGLIGFSEKGDTLTVHTTPRKLKAMAKRARAYLADPSKSRVKFKPSYLKAVIKAAEELEAAEKAAKAEKKRTKREPEICPKCGKPILRGRRKAS